MAARKTKTTKKTARKKTTRRKAPSKRRTSRAPTKVPEEPPDQIPSYATQEGSRKALALPHHIRDAIINILAKELPMEKAEGAVNMLRQLPEVTIQ